MASRNAELEFQNRLKKNLEQEQRRSDLIQGPNYFTNPSEIQSSLQNKPYYFEDHPTNGYKPLKNGGSVKRYKKGGEYEMSHDDVQKLIQQGYKIQYL